MCTCQSTERVMCVYLAEYKEGDVWVPVRVRYREGDVSDDVYNCCLLDSSCLDLPVSQIPVNRGVYACTPS